MRTKLGLAVATMTAASVLAFGAPAAATTPPADTPIEVDAQPESEAPLVTEETTTTTTAVPVIDGPIVVRPGQTEGGDAADPAPPQRGSQIVINPPPTTTTTTTTLPPRPNFSLPANSGTGRRAVYSKSLQKVWVVDGSGRLIKEHRVSGKQLWCDPRPGTYSVFSRSRYTFALSNPSIIWGYMVRFTKGCQGGNIGFHEIPTNKNTGRKVQSISQLGTPLSGGCVRQGVSDAIWMWNWAYVGTKVVVLP
jgi:lipoprotein-anchoring transpeptidase ErfK/SrfK